MALEVRSAESPLPSQHPDLSSEVTTLSNKLITAINHQTDLDDSLAAARHELEHSKEQIRLLEASNQEYAKAVSDGILVAQSDVDDELAKLRDVAEGERAARLLADKARKKIELEVETLTAALFEEANQVRISLGLCSDIVNYTNTS